jgi:ferritin-like metal-binding protein YciE
MAKAAISKELKAGFTKHLAETKGQVTRLEKVFKLLDMQPKVKKSKTMLGLELDAKEIMKLDYDFDVLNDAALIASAQGVEHHEIAGYGTAIAWAKQLAMDDVVELLEETLEEEVAVDEKLTEISEAEMEASNRGRRCSSKRRGRILALHLL